MKLHFVLAGMMAAALGSAQADTYRWVDQSGKVHYGDAPPTTEEVRVEQKKFPTTPEAGNADLPYETRHAQQNFPVTLYVSSNCGAPCQQARDFLNKRGIPFTEKSLLTQEEINTFTKQSGSDQSPTLAVGKAYLKGFQADQWSSELDTAGYPKIAPYRPKTPAKALTDKPAAK